MKNAVLGKSYDLSLVFVGQAKSRALNKQYRGKDKSTNVLSFPLSDTSGEIYIDLVQCRKEAAKFGRSLNNFIQFLFIHGLFHLKGLDHGATMESAEARTRKKFGI